MPMMGTRAPPRKETVTAAGSVSDIAGEVIAVASGGEGRVVTEPGAVRGGVDSDVLVTTGIIELGG